MHESHEYENEYTYTYLCIHGFPTAFICNKHKMSVYQFGKPLKAALATFFPPRSLPPNLIFIKSFRHLSCTNERAIRESIRRVAEVNAHVKRSLTNFQFVYLYFVHVSRCCCLHSGFKRTSITVNCQQFQGLISCLCFQYMKFVFEGG